MHCANTARQIRQHTRRCYPLQIASATYLILWTGVPIVPFWHVFRGQVRVYRLLIGYRKPVTAGSGDTCQRDCVPKKSAETCTSMTSKEECHRATACRWKAVPIEPFESTLQTDMRMKMRTDVCPSWASMLSTVSPQATDEELMATCRQAMNCSTIDPSICAHFLDDEMGSSNRHRRLLTVTSNGRSFSLEGMNFMDSASHHTYVPVQHMRFQGMLAGDCCRHLSMQPLPNCQSVIWGESSPPAPHAK